LATGEIELHKLSKRAISNLRYLSERNILLFALSEGMGPDGQGVGEQDVYFFDEAKQTQVKQLSGVYVWTYSEDKNVFTTVVQAYEPLVLREYKARQ
jgi:hypothetical protein